MRRSGNRVDQQGWSGGVECFRNNCHCSRNKRNDIYLHAKLHLLEVSPDFHIPAFLNLTRQGRNQDFAKGRGDLKMENFCAVILMTYFR